MPKSADDSFSASLLEISTKKNQFLYKYKHITIDDKSIEVLMEPSSSSVITYVKPGLIEKKVFPLQGQSRQLMERDP